MISPITKLLKEDFKQFKDSRKNYEKMLDKYDSMVSKYTSQSKTKEASALREDAFQLYEVRKSYIKASMDYTIHCIEFKSLLDSNVVERFMAGWAALLDKEKSAPNDARARDQLARLQDWSLNIKSATAAKMEDTKSLRAKLEETAITNAKPNRSLTVYSSIPTAVQAPVSTSKSPTKQGYLNMRMSVGKPARNVWVKRWFFIRNGTFGYCTLGQGRFRTVVEESEKIGVLLCEAKLDPSQERRFCFEVQCSKLTSFMLQTETEQELTDWIQAFEQAKRFVIESTPTVDLAKSAAAIVTPGPSPGMLAAGTTSAMRSEEDNMSLSDSGNSTPPQASAFQLQHGRKTSAPPAGGIAALVAASTMAVSTSPTAQNEVKPSSTGVALQSQLSMMLARDAAAQALSGVNSSTTAQGGLWGVPWSTLVPGIGLNLLGLGGEEGAPVNGVLSIAENKTPIKVGTGRDEITNYSQGLLLHNTQFHVLFPDVPESERVLNAFTNIHKLDDLHLTGHTYITEKRLAFYSNLVGSVTRTTVLWSDVTNVENKTRKTYDILTVTTPRSKYSFKTYLRSSAVEAAQMKLIWKHDEEESLQGLFEKLRRAADPNAAPDSTHQDGDDASHMEDAEAEDGSDLDNDDASLASGSDMKSLTSRNPLPATASGAFDDSLIVDQSDQVPADLDPSGPVQCGCDDHLEKLEAEEVYNVPAKKLFDIMFGDTSDFWDRLHKRKGDTMLGKGKWQGNGETTRELKYMMIINNPMSKVKETDCIETQVLVKKEEYLAYVVQAGTKAAAVPYSDAFTPYIRYCITHIDKRKSKLKCHIGVKFWKNPMVKAIIRKAAMNGIAETSHDVVTLLREDVRKIVSSSSGSTISRQSSLAQSTKRRKPERKITARERPELKPATSQSLQPKPRGTAEWMIVAAQSTFGNAFNSIAGILNELKAHRVLILALIMSLFINIMSLIWTNKHALQDRLLGDVLTIPRVRPRRSVKHSVMLSDLEDNFFANTSIVVPSLNENQTCYSTYRAEQGHIVNREREKIGRKRYELLLEFKLLNRMEMDKARQQYGRWLIAENAKCSTYKSSLTGEEAGVAKVVSHCEMCEVDLQALLES